jgi:hypothetical protein
MQKFSIESEHFVQFDAEHFTTSNRLLNRDLYDIFQFSL